MTLTADFLNNNKEFKLVISGAFDFSKVREFRKLVDVPEMKQVEKVTIDLYNTECIDSSGLGILLALQKDFHIDKQSFEIINANDAIKNIFKMTAFEKVVTVK
ncbi:MAG: STAS domain-containing protein [Woeseiaceae bacterium]